MLADKEARQFYKVVEEIRRERPPIFLLENVIGLLRVKNDVMNELSTVGSYFIHHLMLDPLQYACPASRKRVYFIGTR